MHRLRVELKSPVCPGSGIGRPGYVDRDVCFDQYGLPYLAGRRLRGLLREVYDEIADSLGWPASTHDDLFGRIGDSAPGAIAVGTARLPDWQQTSTWLDAALKEVPNAVHREEVMDYFCEVRRQTSIDPITEAPAGNTLRATRILRRGLVFYARIDGLTAATEKAVAVSAAAVQSMGASRTRGLGHVECRLEEADALSAEPKRDITSEALTELEAGTVTLSLDKHRERRSFGLPDTRGVSDAPTHMLRFRVTLREPALIPQLGGDPNLVTTTDFIPGSVIQGVFAAQYLRRRSVDHGFYNLITSGEVLFLGAHPAIEAKRAVRVPSSIRRSKEGNGETHDLVYYGSEESMSRVHGWTVLETLDDRRALRTDVRKAVHYHHQRPKDRRIGKVVSAEQRFEYGLEETETGAFFTYESLQPGQTFIGALVGRPEALAELRSLLTADDVVRLGRSKNTQYGGDARWDWVDDAPAPIAEEAAGWEEWLSSDYEEDPGQLVITLLSPMLTRNEHGHFVPRLPLEELEEALGGKCTIVQKKQFTRTIRWGGYLSHQRLPRQQVTGLDAGSVFIIEGPSDKIADAQRRSYGERLVEGFGRVSIRCLERRPDKQIEFKPLRQQVSGVAKVEVGPAYELALGLFTERLMEKARAEALKATVKGDQLLSNAFLHRLAALVQNTPLEDIHAALGQFRKTAATHLDRCTVGQASLREHISHVVKTTHTQAQEWAGHCHAEQGVGWYHVFAEPKIDSELAERVVRSYLVRLIERIALRRRARKAEAGAPA